MKKVGIGVAGFFLVGAVIALAFWVAGDRQIVGPGEKLESVNGRLTVPKNRIPDDFPGLLSAASIVLLPNHIESDPVEGDIKNEDVENLLSVWESIAPAKTYPKRVGEISTDESNESLYRREDSVDPPGSCGYQGCRTLEWAPGSFGDMRIEAYDGERAHVTGTGVVKYVGVPGFDPRHEMTYIRYYGLILRKKQGRWLLERAAAETGEPVGA